MKRAGCLQKSASSWWHACLAKCYAEQLEYWRLERDSIMLGMVSSGPASCAKMRGPLPWQTCSGLAGPVMWPAGLCCCHGPGLRRKLQAPAHMAVCHISKRSQPKFFILGLYPVSRLRTTASVAHICAWWVA